MTTLSLHQMNALEVEPSELVDLAAETGCQAVSVFVHQQDPRSQFPLVTADNKAAFQQRLRDTGIRVLNVEAFMIAPGVDVESFRAGFELGAELGARGISVILVDSDRARVEQNLARVCELAGEYHLRVGIEFMPLMPGWGTLREAADLVARLDQPNLGIGIDLLHLVRSGGSAEQVAALDPALIAHVQLCDSASLDVSRDYAAEAAGDRLAPGDGVFPLQAFLEALPADLALEMEVPQPVRHPARERVRHIVEATRKLLAPEG